MCVAQGDLVAATHHVAEMGFLDLRVSGCSGFRVGELQSLGGWGNRAFKNLVECPLAVTDHCPFRHAMAGQRAAHMPLWLRLLPDMLFKYPVAQNW